MSDSRHPNLLFNEIRFERMACGDLDGFFELAEEYLTDVRKRMHEWPRLLEAREFGRLSEDFHRCKGGAAMFGFERLYSIFGSVETEADAELVDGHLERFAGELDAAESAMFARKAKSANA